MNPLFRKGDRIERIQGWGPDGAKHGLTKTTGTVLEDTYDPETIRWRVDGYSYPQETSYHIATSSDVKAIGQGGMNCHKCNNPNPWGKPNQPDGKTYICFECRS